MQFRNLLAAALLACACGATAFAQTTPTGILTGKVLDPDDLPMPGVTITATSAALQGPKTTVTSTNGDYVLPFLPAGDYKVRFELSGFQTVEKNVRVQVAETVTLDAKFKLAGVSETVTVSAMAETGDFTTAPTVSTSFKAENIDKLPVSRTLEGAVLLAPGTTNNGPQGNITFSGALSYEGLFLLNGVVLNETLRAQARTLYIEDAIQETKTSTAAISAEYGRFSGGVSNTITKSGGNALSGSFRTTFTNDTWTDLTPYDKDRGLDPRVSDAVPTYEGTLGGPILRDRLWYFAAGRYQNRTFSETLAYTNVPITRGQKDKRYEGKLTWTLTAGQTAKASYTKRDQKFKNNWYTGGSPIMDTKSLYDNSQPEDLTSFNYTGVFKSKFFLEGQYSRRRLSFIGTGSRYTDMVNGTLIFDLSRGQVRWNSPTFCAVCGAAEGKLNEEKRNNQNFIVKGSYFLSTSNAGSHNIVVGADAFEDMRKNDNYQNGSSYRLYATNTIIRGADLFPVVTPGVSYITYLPILEHSKGSSLRSYSGFANDSWRLNNRWSFNVGLRWDRVDAKDQSGNQAAKGDAFSPRLAATFDPSGSGTWTFNTGVARYAMGANSAISDLGSTGGRQASFSYLYQGPAFNADLNTPSPLTSAQVLPQVFDWFFANGGTGRPLRTTPSYPGVNRRVSADLKAPSTWEYSAGVARTLGSKGAIRVDGIFRNYRDFYAERKDMSTGRVADPDGRLYDLGIVVNTDAVERAYKALQAQAQYRFFANLSVGGNYTLSQSRGNFNGETSSDGPTTADVWFYPEYRNPKWNAPIGDLSIDQRHKSRIWMSYLSKLPGRAGSLDFGVMHRMDSGQPFSDDGTVDTRPYVANPGYLTPPASVSYYFGGRGTRKTGAIFATDLSINYYLPVGFSSKSQFFMRVVVENIFNNAAQTGEGQSQILTNRLDPTIARFNPFTDTPVEGVNYRFASDYGRAVSADDYQRPRNYYFAAGFRF